MQMKSAGKRSKSTTWNLLGIALHALRLDSTHFSIDSTFQDELSSPRTWMAAPCEPHALVIEGCCYSHIIAFTWEEQTVDVATWFVHTCAIQKVSFLCSFPRWWYCSCCFGMKFHSQLTSSASMSLSQANPKCCRIRSTFQASLRQEGDARSPVVSRLVVSPWNSNTDPGWTISEPKNLISWLAALTSS